jgi:hypothetical protein
VKKCAIFSYFDGRTDRQTDRRTDLPFDIEDIKSKFLKLAHFIEMRGRI